MASWVTPSLPCRGLCIGLEGQEGYRGCGWHDQDHPVIIMQLLILSSGLGRGTTILMSGMRLLEVDHSRMSSHSAETQRTEAGFAGPFRPAYTSQHGPAYAVLRVWPQRFALCVPWGYDYPGLLNHPGTNHGLASLCHHARVWIIALSLVMPW